MLLRRQLGLQLRRLQSLAVPPGEANVGKTTYCSRSWL